VSVSLLVAARKGDPAAFARLVEHWDPWLRPFVHHTLGAEGNTEQVLAATYVRAYRALPRYQAERTPGLWLHRIAYLVATDELRRIHRDVRRRRRAGDARDTEATPVIDLDAPPDLPAGWYGLGPDQRAFAVMVDLEGFDPDSVADALDTVGLVVTERLAPARKVLARADPSWSEPVPDPEPVADPEPPLPSWMADPGPRITEPTGPEVEARRREDEKVLAGAARGVLAALPVPPAGREFWPGVGRRLLAERESPAAPTLDPVARLARSHPAEPGFAPADPGHERRSRSVSSLAVQADRRRPSRRWGRFAGIAVAVLAVVGLVAGAVSIGLSAKPRDGSVSGPQLARTISAALADGRYVSLLASVTEAGPTGSVGHDSYLVSSSDDGSWAVAVADRVDLTTFDAPAGLVRHVATVGGDAGAEATTLATEDTGLAPGSPDPTAEPPAFLDDLRALGALLRTGGRRAAPTHLDGMATWTWQGPSASGERWRVVVRRSDGRPLLVERRRDGRLVRRSRLSRWSASSGSRPDTFRQDFDEGVVPTASAHGFLPTELSGVSILGRGPAVTPAWLPSGFELAAVTIRQEAAPGQATTAGGDNPPDVSVMSLAFQRGIERITVTNRVALDPTAWRDPFGTGSSGGSGSGGSGSGGSTTRKVLGNGRYNGTEVRVTTDGAGRARLWGLADGALFTVSGDLTTADALRLAASLR
jgi:RNA polymerase sigma-70 factor (ECF subfamily)